MKTISATLLAFGLVFGPVASAQQPSRYAVELDQLIEQRDKAIASANKPINDKFITLANALLQRAIQSGDLDGAMKIRTAIQITELPDPNSALLGSWTVSSSSGWRGVYTFEKDGVVKVFENGAQTLGGKWTLEGATIRTRFGNGENDTIEFPPVDGKMNAKTGRGYKMSLERKR